MGRSGLTTGPRSATFRKLCIGRDIVGQLQTTLLFQFRRDHVGHGESHYFGHGWKFIFARLLAKRPAWSRGMSHVTRLGLARRVDFAISASAETYLVIEFSLD